jgi:hypothetical protein
MVVAMGAVMVIPIPPKAKAIMKKMNELEYMHPIIDTTVKIIPTIRSFLLSNFTLSAPIMMAVMIARNELAVFIWLVIPMDV